VISEFIPDSVSARQIVDYSEDWGVGLGEILDIAAQIIKGANYLLTELDYIDRDLENMDNYLVTRDGIVKLVDFGKIGPREYDVRFHKTKIIAMGIRILCGRMMSTAGRKEEIDARVDRSLKLFTKRFGKEKEDIGREILEFLHTAAEKLQDRENPVDIDLNNVIIYLRRMAKNLALTGMVKKMRERPHSGVIASRPKIIGAMAEDTKAGAKDDFIREFEGENARDILGFVAESAGVDPDSIEKYEKEPVKTEALGYVGRPTEVYFHTLKLAGIKEKLCFYTKNYIPRIVRDIGPENLHFNEETEIASKIAPYGIGVGARQIETKKGKVLVMRPARGVNMAESPQGFANTPEKRLGIAKAIMRALGGLHALGVIHNDLAESGINTLMTGNIFLSEENSADEYFASFIDFGSSYMNSPYVPLKKSDFEKERIAVSEALLVRMWLGDADLGELLNAYTAGYWSFEPETGNIAGDAVSEEEETGWRQDIELGRDSVKASDEDAEIAMGIIEGASGALLAKEARIRRMLLDRGVADAEIDEVFEALRNTRESFRWFDAIVIDSEKYLLGHESALAANVIKFLKKRKKNESISPDERRNLVEEYLLHEALERTSLGHGDIILFTTDLFGRGDFDEGFAEPSKTPLGAALRDFIRTESEKAEKLAIALRGIGHDAEIFDIEGQIGFMQFAAYSLKMPGNPLDVIIGNAASPDSVEGSIYKIIRGNKGWGPQGENRSLEELRKEIKERSEGRTLSSRMVPGFIHECGEILYALKVKRDYIEGELNKDKECKGVLYHLDNAIFILDNLIRFAEGKVPREKVELKELGNLIRSSIVAEKNRPNRSTTVDVQLESFLPDGAEVTINRLFFKASVFNLIKNAVDAVDKSRKRGKINGTDEVKIRVEAKLVETKEGKEVRIYVIDRAEGIASDSPLLMRHKETGRKRIFELNVTTGGTGLGLALVWNVADLIHGGDIDLESRHIDRHPDDHGTTFTMTLPLSLIGEMRDGSRSKPRPVPDLSPDSAPTALDREKSKSSGDTPEISAGTPRGSRNAPFSTEEDIYEVAQKIIPKVIHAIRRHTHTFDIAPAHYEGESKAMSLFRTAERTLNKNDGPSIRARCYAFGNGNWYAGLEKQVESMLSDFYKKVNSEDQFISKPTRMSIRLLTKDAFNEKGEKIINTEDAIVNFIIGHLMEEFKVDRSRAEKIAELHVRVIKVDVGEAKHLNNAIDLFADIGLMEYDRYVKGDYKDESVPDSLLVNLGNLLRLSVENRDYLKNLTVEGTMEELNKILTGAAILRIRAIDWDSLSEWRKKNDKILQSL